jgi:hypothetical protein
VLAPLAKERKRERGDRVVLPRLRVGNPVRAHAGDGVPRTDAGAGGLTRPRHPDDRHQEGQRAIAVAVEMRARGLTVREGADEFDISMGYISLANTVLDYGAAELVDSVKSGAISLNDAYAVARARKDGLGP